MNKKLAITILIITIMLLSGCNIMEKYASPSRDKMVMDILENSSYENLATARQYFETDTGVKTINNTILKIDTYISGEEIESLELIGFYVSASTTRDYNIHEVTYKLVTDADEYVLTLVINDYTDTGTKLVSNIDIMQYDSMFDKGKIIDMDNLIPMQVILLIFSALGYGFTIYVFIVAIKSRINHKWLWLLFIALVQSGMILTNTPNSSNFNIMVYVAKLSSLRIFNNGSTVYSIMLPSGAIIFLAIKNILVKKRLEKDELAKQNSENIPTDEAT